MGKQKIPVQKNDIVQVTCTDFTHDGNGVCKIDEYPLFVPYMIKGERAKVKVVKVNKRFGYGKLIKVIDESRSRREAPCNVFYQCGGCQLQHMTYDMQLEMKREQVKDVMRKIARLDDVIVHPVFGTGNEWRYRNKIQMPVGEKDGELITGFYKPRSHQMVADMETCHIQNEFGDEIVATARDIASSLGVIAYDEKNNRGQLRHIITRTAQKTNDTMVIFVTRTEHFPEQKELVDQLTKYYPEIKSIIQNINSKKTNVILGETSKTLYGESFIYDTIGDLTFKLSPKSFFQVNNVQTEKLYDVALQYAKIDRDDVVVDAYCGIGSISLFLAKRAKKVYGVEIVAEAVEAARDNAKLNDVDNVEFVVGKAEEVMPQWYEDGLRPDVIIVDPPRKGCDEKLLEAMLAMKPERIVYVSCNPSTLARDLRFLEDGGYKTEEVQPVDMFSQTYHVENVARLERICNQTKKS
ncbi:MAG TPA: 23S rRNA (uracil(1939)-C(5))-methyltransferase RlmD [Pseudogracilibacillus sp.]|nr:23S rRNA (uracil(1939)-C(5))-methyltransferase RlmD [Pseudogracilibacillus sp.]